MWQSKRRNFSRYNQSKIICINCTALYHITKAIFYRSKTKGLLSSSSPDTSTHGAHIRQTKLNESRRKHSNLRKNKRTIVREQKNKRRTQEQRKTPNREQIIKNKAGKRRFQNHQRTQVLK